MDLIPAVPEKTSYPLRVAPPNWATYYPPTVHGITKAVLRWRPISQAHANGSRYFEIFHDTQVEEAMEHFKVYITALIAPDMAERLATSQIGWTVPVIIDQLAQYLNRIRPLNIAFVIMVLVQAPHQEGPYR